MAQRTLLKSRLITAILGGDTLVVIEKLVNNNYYLVRDNTKTYLWKISDIQLINEEDCDDNQNLD